MDDIGQRIRSARKLKGWTLESLASSSGLSIGFLSQVERGLTSLSIASLSAICRALGVPMESMVSSTCPTEATGSAITKSSQQIHLRVGNSPISYCHLSSQLPEAPIQELLIAEFPPAFAQDDTKHPGCEMGFILAGSLLLLIDDNQYPLTVGDSYRVEPYCPHGYRTSADSSASVMMAVTERLVDMNFPTPPVAVRKDNA